MNLKCLKPCNPNLPPSPRLLNTLIFQYFSRDYFFSTFWFCSPSGRTSRGERRPTAAATSACHGRRGRSLPRGQSKGHRGRGRAEGRQGFEGGLGHHIRIAGGSAAPIPSDVDQHFGREELDHHFPAPHRTLGTVCGIRPKQKSRFGDVNKCGT